METVITLAVQIFGLACVWFSGYILGRYYQRSA